MDSLLKEFSIENIPSIVGGKSNEANDSFDFAFEEGGSLYTPGLDLPSNNEFSNKVEVSLNTISDEKIDLNSISGFSKEKFSNLSLNTSLTTSTSTSSTTSELIKFTPKKRFEYKTHEETSEIKIEEEYSLEINSPTLDFIHYIVKEYKVNLLIIVLFYTVLFFRNPFIFVSLFFPILICFVFAFNSI